MILHIEKKMNINSHICKNKTKTNNCDFFLKNIHLQIYKSRLLINANKFNAFISNLILAWSYKINEKAYVNRRRIFRRNTCSSY